MSLKTICGSCTAKYESQACLCIFCEPQIFSWLVNDREFECNPAKQAMAERDWISNLLFELLPFIPSSVMQRPPASSLQNMQKLPGFHQTGQPG